MAPRKAKKESFLHRLGAAVGEWLLPAGGPAERPWLRYSVRVATVLAIIFATGWGFAKMEQRVVSLERYQQPLYLEWELLPDWLQLPDNRHILDALARSVDLGECDRQLDSELASRIGTALARPSVGWVREVERVRVRSDGIVTVRCQFRRPAAWVRYGKSCYLVDEHRVRLPGRYQFNDSKGSGLITVLGTRTPPPAVGHVWDAADLSAGVLLVELLKDRPFRHQVTAVYVDNYNGREDAAKPYIELATDRKDSRVWWGRPPNEEFGREPTAAQKITLLESLYRRWGRIDMNRPYVSVTTWPDRVAMPKPMSAIDTSEPARHPGIRLLRG